MKPEQYTIKLREALNSSLELASGNGNPEIGCEHFLLSLLEQPEGLVRPLLEKMGVSIPALTGELQTIVEGLSKVSGAAQPQLSRELRGVLEGAEREMKTLRDEYVSVEHFLLALLASGCPAARLLKDAGVTRDRLMQALAAVRGNQRVTDQDPEGKYQTLEK